MLASPLALAGSAAFADIWPQTLFRLAAGVAGAAAFISGGAMAAMLFRVDAGRNALAISLYFGGGGLGMIASGATLPLLLDGYGAGSWPWAWICLAALSALAVMPALAAARRSEDPSASAARNREPLPLKAMARLILGYALFAVGYIVYLTFFVALLRETAAPASLLAMCWTLLGLGVIAAPFLWRRVLAQATGGGALGLACLGTGSATLLPLVAPGHVPALFLSVSLFGMCFFMAPTAVTSFSRRNLDQLMWGRAVAMFTTVFAAGQIVGPTAAGAITDAMGSLAHGLGAAGLLLLCGAGAAGLQRPLCARDAGGHA
jgi:MFS family permease